MTNPTTTGLATALLALRSAALAETPPGDLPAAIAPARFAGSGLNVVDLEAQGAWYVSMLGMSVTATYRRDGDLPPGRRAVRICHGPEGARRHPGAA